MGVHTVKKPFLGDLYSLTYSKHKYILSINVYITIKLYIKYLKIINISFHIIPMRFYACMLLHSSKKKSP
jgi:hypothetical protein